HAPVSSDSWPRGSPPRRQPSTTAISIGRRDEGSAAHTTDGNAVVSVRSSLRARRADSRTATAGCAMIFALYSPDYMIELPWRSRGENRSDYSVFCPWSTGLGPRSSVLSPRSTVGLGDAKPRLRVDRG